MEGLALIRAREILYSGKKCCKTKLFLSCGVIDDESANNDVTIVRVGRRVWQHIPQRTVIFREYF